MNVTKGTLSVLSMMLFQYWYPTKKLLTRVLDNTEFSVTLAICKWFLVKLPSVRSPVVPA